MAERSDLQIFDHILHLFFCLFFRNPKIKNPKRDFLKNAGRKELIVRILEYNPYLAAELQKIFSFYSPLPLR